MAGCCNCCNGAQLPLLHGLLSQLLPLATGANHTCLNPTLPRPNRCAGCWRFVAVWVLYSCITGYYLYRCSSKKLDKSVPRQVSGTLLASSHPRMHALFCEEPDSTGSRPKK